MHINDSEEREHKLFTANGEKRIAETQILLAATDEAAGSSGWTVYPEPEMVALTF